MNARLSDFLQWRSLVKRLFNMACFYGGWLICMREATGPTPYFGPFVVAVLLFYQLAFSHMLLVDITLIATLAVAGTLIDSLYIWAGLIEFQGGYQCCPHVAPLWITALWALYASSINHSLEWLKLHLLLLAAPLGAAGAISSYLVGVKLEAAHFPNAPLLSLCVIGVVWGAVVPASLVFSGWLKRSVFAADSDIHPS